MKITGIKLYTVKSGDNGARSAAQAESQYWGGGWQAQTLISNPMPVHPKYSRIRSLWMGGGPGFGVELKRELLAPFKG